MKNPVGEFEKIKRGGGGWLPKYGNCFLLSKLLFNFAKLPKSKNEISLKLEQYRAIDAGISIGVTFEKNIPPSIDTKEDLITAESIIRANHEKN